MRMAHCFQILEALRRSQGRPFQASPRLSREDQVIMTGSTTRISKLGYGEVEQFLRDLTEEGLGGHHIRDFRMDKSTFREWVQYGLALLEGQWTTLPTCKPTHAWTEIDGTDIWAQYRGDPGFLEEDGALMFTVWFSTIVGGHRSNARFLSLHPVKWKTIFGVQVRQADMGCIEVRVPAQHDAQVVVDESDEWEPIWSAQLGRGTMVSVGKGYGVKVTAKNHFCFLCQGDAPLTIELIGWDNGKREEQLVHLYGTDWIPVTQDLQIRAVPNTKNAIEVRDRKH